MIRDTLAGQWTDQRYLRGEQYRDSGNLRARIPTSSRNPGNISMPVTRQTKKTGIMARLTNST